MNNTLQKTVRFYDEVVETIDCWQYEVRTGVPSLIEDARDWFTQLWYWDEKLERLLIRLRIRKEFDFDRFCELVGVSDDDYVDSSNYHLPERYELQEFVGCLLEDYEFRGDEDVPVTTIQVANAYEAAQEHDAWI